MKKLAAEEVYDAIRTPTTFTRPETSTPQFNIGDEVSVRNMHPRGHTRLPGYARGRRGKVVIHHGFFVYPDTMAHGLGDQPQHLYNVRFATQELFGEMAEDGNDWVYVDMWEGYLTEAVGNDH